MALTLKKLLSHINSLHSRSPDFRVVCGIDDCPSEYRVYNSYYYHIKRTHAHHLLQVDGAEEEGSTRHASSGTREGTTTIIQTNVSSVVEVHPTQQHSSETEEGSSVVTPTVRLYLCFLARLILHFVVVIAIPFTCFNRDIILFQCGFQEGGEGRVNVDFSKYATAFLLQARETHRLTRVIFSLMYSVVF